MSRPQLARMLGKTGAAPVPRRPGRGRTRNKTLYKHRHRKTVVEESPPKDRYNNVTKIYCSRCDTVFESREKFEGHLGMHASGPSGPATCETCPIDAAVARLVRFLRQRVRPGHGGA